MCSHHPSHVQDIFITSERSSVSISHHPVSPSLPCQPCVITNVLSVCLFWAFPMNRSVPFFVWLFSCSITLCGSHGLQHASLLCPQLSPRVCSKLTSTESVIPSNHLILCCPLLLLPSVFSSIRVFTNEHPGLISFRMNWLDLPIRWPKYWSFSFSISPSIEYSGLISFRIDQFDLFAVQGTLKSLLQHHSLKASILHCSAFFMVQLSHLSMTTGKTITLTIRTFVSEVMISAF